jgi:hypothetical protein
MPGTAPRTGDASRKAVLGTARGRAQIWWPGTHREHILKRATRAPFTTPVTSSDPLSRARL